MSHLLGLLRVPSPARCPAVEQVCGRSMAEHASSGVQPGLAMLSPAVTGTSRGDTTARVAPGFLPRR